MTSVPPFTIVDPTTLPKSWTERPLVKLNESDVTTPHHFGPITWGTSGTGDLSTAFSLNAGQYGTDDADGKMKVQGDAFAPVVKLNATNVNDAVVAAQQFATQLPKAGDSAGQIPQYRRDTGKAAAPVNSDNVFGKWGSARPVVAVLHNKADGAYYAAAFGESLYPNPQGLFHSKVSESDTFTPLQGAVKAVVLLGKSVQTPNVGAPATITATH